MLHLWMTILKVNLKNTKNITFCLVLTMDDSSVESFFFFFWDRVSLCSPDCPRTHSIDQAGFELIEIHLPLPPKCWECMLPLSDKDVFVVHVYECFVCILIYASYACNTCRGQERALVPLDLELKMVVSCCVGARNLAWILWKSSQCSLTTEPTFQPHSFLFLHWHTNL